MFMFTFAIAVRYIGSMERQIEKMFIEKEFQGYNSNIASTNQIIFLHIYLHIPLLTTLSATSTAGILPVKLAEV